MSTLHQRISLYLHEHTPDGRRIETAESDSLEYEYLLARAEANLQSAQELQDKLEQDLAEGQSSPTP
jgi:hypothetical protein